MKFWAPEAMSHDCLVSNRIESRLTTDNRKTFKNQPWIQGIMLDFMQTLKEAFTSLYKVQHYVKSHLLWQSLIWRCEALKRLNQHFVCLFHVSERIEEGNRWVKKIKQTYEVALLVIVDILRTPTIWYQFKRIWQLIYQF